MRQFVTVPDKVELESALSELMCSESMSRCEVLLSCAGSEIPIVELAEALAITAQHDCRSFASRIRDFVERVVPDPIDQTELLGTVNLMLRY